MLNHHKRRLAGPIEVDRCPHCWTTEVQELVFAWHDLTTGSLAVESRAVEVPAPYFCVNCGGIESTVKVRETRVQDKYQRSFKQWEALTFGTIVRDGSPLADKILRAVAFIAWDKDKRRSEGKEKQCAAVWPAMEAFRGRGWYGMAKMGADNPDNPDRFEAPSCHMTGRQNGRGTITFKSIESFWQVGRYWAEWHWSQGHNVNARGEDHE
jgi:hypothetical protein